MAFPTVVEIRREAPRDAVVQVVDRPRSQRRELLALAGLAALLALTIRAHGMWFDELQAWNIARASHTLPELYAHLRYEGHPIVWYLALFPITRVTGDPRMMQILQWAIAVGVFAVVLLRSPFPLWARVSLCCGYFFAFEFSVLSRSYGLGVLLWLGALAHASRARPRWGIVAGLLALLAWTSTLGTVLAVAFVLSMLFSSGAGWRPRLAGLSRQQRRAIGTVLAASLASVATCVPPDDFRSFTAGLGSTPSRFGSGLVVQLASGLSGTWRGLAPVARSPGDWNSQLLDVGAVGLALQVVLSVVLVMVVAAVLRPAPFARHLWLVGSALYFVFFEAVVLPELAHYAGWLFLLFLGCMWLAWPTDPLVPRRNGGMKALLACVLCAQIVATGLMLVPLSFDDFSPDRALAQAVVRERLQRDIVSADDYDATAVGAYLDRRVYSIVQGKPIRFVINDVRELRGNLELTRSSALCAAGALAFRRGRPVALVVRGAPSRSEKGVESLVRERGVELLRVGTGYTSASCGTDL